MTDRTIGFIGLGIMGQPMALNLLKAGYGLAVYGRRPESMAPLVAAGATACGSPREVAAQAEIIITMVSDTPDVEAVLLGADGVIQGARAGAIVIDMSSISPIATRQMAARLAAKGVQLLDAPVSGGDIGARDGTLSIMVGGEETSFTQVLPVLQVLGKNIVYIGGSGAGQVTKLANNLVVAATVAGIGEAFVMASKAGVDPARVRDALLGGFAASRALEVHGLRMIDDNYQPGFKARLHAKDLKNALETARDLGLDLPATAMNAGYLNALVGQGGGELDSTAMVRILEQMNGTRIKS